jgi:hypothetical protein
MSSGLRIRAPQDPDYDPFGLVYLYTGGVDSYHYAASRPQQWPPNTVGRYHNTDPATILVARRAALSNGPALIAWSPPCVLDRSVLCSASMPRDGPLVRSCCSSGRARLALMLMSSPRVQIPMAALVLPLRTESGLHEANDPRIEAAGRR